MHTAFRAHLESLDACFSRGVVSHFRDQSGEREALGQVPTLHPLGGDGLIRVTGADAPAFLQGQLSNDIRELDDGRAQLTTWCTPQGRVLAILLAWREHEDYLLQLPLDLVPPIRARLERFVLRARVKLDDATTTRALIGVAGPEAHAVLSATLGGAAEAAMRIATVDSDLRVLTLRRGLYQLVVPGERSAAVWDALAERARPCGTPGWDWHRIQACLPTVTAATQDRFVPQMLDLEHSGAISFSKGCYPGQEIVARSQYLGQVKRRLFRVHAHAREVAPGEDLSAGGLTVGTVVNAAPAPRGGWDALAVLQLEAAAEGGLMLQGPAVPVTVSGSCH